MTAENGKRPSNVKLRVMHVREPVGFSAAGMAAARLRSASSRRPSVDLRSFHPLAEVKQRVSAVEAQETGAIAVQFLSHLHGDDFRQVLGRVIAHEVGHLVLPVYSHSDQGIMRADVGFAPKATATSQLSKLS
jgi:hypothetical protein